MYKMVNGILTPMTAEEIADRDKEERQEKSERKRTQWLRDRTGPDGYPSVEDQLDLLWHDISAGKPLNKNSRWYKVIDGVKSKYPKPEDVE